jgi:hypothetical protein
MVIRVLGQNVSDFGAGDVQVSQLACLLLAIWCMSLDHCWY